MAIGYADLSLNSGDEREIVEMLRLALKLGHRLVAVEDTGSLDFEKLQSIAASLGVKVLRRVTIRGSSRADIRRALDNLPRGATGGVLVSVEPESFDAARYAGVNKRVHLVRVKPGMESLLDRSQVRLFESRGWGGFEIVLSYIFKPRGWNYIVEVVRRAKMLDARFIAVSGATDVHSMWSPYSVIGLLSSLGLEPSRAAAWVSSSPASIASMALRTSNV